MNIGVISYGAAVLSFSVLLVLLLTSWRGRLQGILLVIAVGMTAAWALFSALFVLLGLPQTISGYQVLEVLRNAAWFTFLLHLLDPIRRAQRATPSGLVGIQPMVLGFTALVLVPLIWLGARGPRWLMAVLVFVLLASCANSWVAYQVFRM